MMYICLLVSGWNSSAMQDIEMRSRLLSYQSSVSQLEQKQLDNIAETILYGDISTAKKLITYHSHNIRLYTMGALMRLCDKIAHNREIYSNITQEQAEDNKALLRICSLGIGALSLFTFYLIDGSIFNTPFDSFERGALSFICSVYWGLYTYRAIKELFPEKYESKETLHKIQHMLRDELINKLESRVYQRRN